MRLNYLNKTKYNNNKTLNRPKQVAKLLNLLITLNFNIMRKVILENKQEQIYLSDLTAANHVGFIDSRCNKGYVAYTGKVNDKNVFSAISMGNYRNFCNTSYGSENFKNSLLEALEINKRCRVSIKELFVFDTRKELYKWLGED